MIAGRATGYTPVPGSFFVETATKFLDGVSAALAEARDALAECDVPESVLVTGTELAQLVGTLTEDSELAVAAWIAPARAPVNFTINRYLICVGRCRTSLSFSRQI